MKISNSAIVTGSITGNVIHGAKDHGILVYNKANVKKDISNNTISNVTRGIFVNTSSVIGGKIKGNTITKASDVPIKVDSSSRTGGIEE